MSARGHTQLRIEAIDTLDLRTQNFTHFDTFIEQADNSTHIRLTRLPEELVFDEMPQRPANLFSALLTGSLPPARTDEAGFA